MSHAARRDLPSVDRLLRHPSIVALVDVYDRRAVVNVLRSELDSARELLTESGEAPSVDTMSASITARIDREWDATPSPVINATGVILHSNLGRAPLSRGAMDAIQMSAGYTNLEFDLKEGTRGARQAHVESQLTALTAADSSHVTVNAASAVLLALASHAAGKEVLISRGQMVEIGGGFRIPDILRQSRAKLVEVGTTNRTVVADYESSISSKTAAMLHVHQSNFRIQGYTQQVALDAMSKLARKHNLLLISDNGSGALIDTARFGLAHEPTVQEAVQAGCDIVAFSGDKLLGGPQAGILVGKRDAISRLRRHPLARVVRPDKITIAALSATLKHYLRREAIENLPVWRMIAQPAQAIAIRAEHIQVQLRAGGVTVRLKDGESTVGGGSIPGGTLPTTLIELPSGVTASGLRGARVPIVARAAGGNCMLDLRTVAREEEAMLVDALLEAYP